MYSRGRPFSFKIIYAKIIKDLFYYFIVFNKGNYPHSPSTSGTGKGIGFVYFFNKSCPGFIALFLYEIFSNILPTGINRKLRSLRKNKISGMELERELIRIKNEFNLSKERKLEAGQKKEIPKIICSQIFVSEK